MFFIFNSNHDVYCFSFFVLKQELDIHFWFGLLQRNQKPQKLDARYIVLSCTLYKYTNNAYTWLLYIVVYVKIVEFVLPSHY